MANNVAKTTEAFRAAVAEAVEAALATRRSRKSAAVAVPQTETERVVTALRMQNGFRGRILRHLIGAIGNKSSATFSYEGLHKVEALKDIDPSNVAACLVHIAWKMQENGGGYTLAVAGRNAEVTAMLSRVAPVAKKGRKATKALPAPVVEPSEGQAA